MATVFILIPILFFICSGYFIKKFYGMSDDKATVLSKIIFNITLPATIFASFLTTAQTIGQSFLLPIAALVIQLGMFVFFWLIANKFQIRDYQRCVFITAPLIGNIMLFLAPFILLAYGEQALSKLMLYHVGNTLTIYFLAHAIFRQCNDARFALIAGVKETLRSAPVWALILGLLGAGVGVTIAEPIQQILTILKNVNIFLPMFLLGYYFKPLMENAKLVLNTVFLKLSMGLLFGFTVSLVFTDPVDRMIVILCAAAPVGVNSLVYASMYGKDAGYAANLISYSMLAGIILLLILT